MAIRVSQKLCYLCHPRTGSRAIAKALRRMPKSQEVGQHHDRLDLPDVLTASNVRRPVDVLLSWHAAYGKGQDVMEWLDTLSNGTLERSGRMFYHADLCDVLLCQERLEADYRELCQLAGLAMIPLRWVRDLVVGVKHQEPPELAAAVRARWPADVNLWETVRSQGKLWHPHSTQPSQAV